MNELIIDRKYSCILQRIDDQEQAGFYSSALFVLCINLMIMFGAVIKFSYNFILLHIRQRLKKDHNFCLFAFRKDIIRIWKRRCDMKLRKKRQKEN